MDSMALIFNQPQSIQFVQVKGSLRHAMSE